VGLKSNSFFQSFLCWKWGEGAAGKRKNWRTYHYWQQDFPASAIPVSAHGGIGNAPSSPSKLRFDQDDHTGLDARLVDFTSAARNRDHSASVSSTSSPQGSIPSIPSPSLSSPSPPPGQRHPSSPYDQPHVPSQPHAPATAHLYPNPQPSTLAGSPMQRHISPTKCSSPPAVSVRNARSHAHTR
jgi:hypothetical protein